jgi:predicted nucleic acid-binding protein
MLSEPVLIDTSAFTASFNPDDPRHADCAAQFQQLPLGKSYTCWPVVTEAVYMARRFPHQQQQFLDAIAKGDFQLLELTDVDVKGIQAVLRKYSDQEVDLADACLVHLAMRERINIIVTLDRRHFHVYRGFGGKPFQLLPA